MGTEAKLLEAGIVTEGLLKEKAKHRDLQRYAAPEVGKEAATAKSDIFSLGITLFEAFLSVTIEERWQRNTAIARLAKVILISIILFFFSESTEPPDNPVQQSRCSLPETGEAIAGSDAGQ